jgi:glyoxylase-like metal-dependent hydrolase (beta-lactamase superfamily II)
LIHVLDLEYGVSRTTAAFVITTREGPILVETGPESTYPALAEGLKGLGYEPEEVRHVLLTHIHLDHAGAAWRFARQGATVYVHPTGARHLQDPSRLLASAGRIFGERTEDLWGTPMPVHRSNIRVVGDGEVLSLGDARIEALKTPGHADHHLTWKVAGAIFTGDVGGVRIGGGPVFSPTPPPEIRVGPWRESIGRLKSLHAEEIYLTHFGRFSDVEHHLDELEACLIDWSEWIGGRIYAKETDEAIVSEFAEHVLARLEQAGVGPDEQEEYEIADPAWMNALGLIRYWRKRFSEEPF